MNRRLLLTLLPLFLAVSAKAAGYSASGEVWAYGSVIDADLPQVPNHSATTEIRLNLRHSDDGREWVLRPRLLQQTSGGRHSSDAYAGQAYLRQRLGQDYTVTVGRELLTWGPAQFRSPSNPLYFDAGRNNPLRDVSGVDGLRLTYTSGSHSATLARVQQRSHTLDVTAPRPLALLKYDQRSDNSLWSVIVADPVADAPWLGGFYQVTPDDAWLLYGEWNNAQRRNRTGQWQRRNTALAGAAYTLENGQSIALEWLYQGHADQGAGPAGELRGRQYSHLLWQSNPQDSSPYWRVSWSRNQRDHSSQLNVYLEQQVGAAGSVFLAVTKNLGGGEFGAVIGSTLTLGAKWFMF